MQIFDKEKVNLQWRNNLVLLICILVLFIVGPSLFIRDAPLIMTIMFTLLILSSMAVIEYAPLVKKVLLFTSILVIVFVWAEYFFPFQSILIISFTLLSVYLFTITISLIVHVALSKDVNANIIFSAINGYLLLGINGSIALLIMDRLSSTNVLSNIKADSFYDYVYFSFVTLTTLGYGDLTPISAGGRALAMLLSITGQLYVAILIAMLVGKFLSKSNNQ
jgi:voltage-gated potassium channel